MIAYRNLKIALWSIAILCLSLLLFSSCTRDLEVQTAYPFSLETMPIRKDIAPGETVEIRCKLSTPQTFADTRYTLRYFQPEGKGILKMDDGLVFKPNDRYPLTRAEFRLYYTSQSADRQTIDVYIEDNFGKVQQLTFAFNNRKAEEDKKKDG